MSDSATSPEVRAAIEAVVLAAVEPVEPQLLAQLLELPVSEGEAACTALAEAYEAEGRDRESTRLNSSHIPLSRMPSSA